MDNSKHNDLVEEEQERVIKTKSESLARSFQDSSDKKHEGNRSKRYTCNIEGCNAAYSKQFRLKIHHRKHSGERPFICNVNGCFKTYTNVAHLKRHKSVVHEANQDIMCSEPGCGMILNSRQNLKKHYLNIHDPTHIPYQCVICNEGFKKKYLLKQHIEGHSADVPKKCESCDMIFSTSRLYVKHKRNHKTFTCDCGVTFEHWTKFCEHRKTSCNVGRIDHKCVICDKVFATSSNLKAHSMTHLEESRKEVYRCVYLNCTRSYKYKKNLDQHVRSFHEKDVTVVEMQCTYPGCSQVLKSKKNLKQHVRNVHSNLPKIEKPRRKRTDKGKPKKSMVDILCGLDFRKRAAKTTITNEENHNMLHNDNSNRESETHLSASEGTTKTDSERFPEVEVENNLVTNISLYGVEHTVVAEILIDQSIPDRIKAAT